MTGRVFGLAKKDIEYMSDLENRFIFDFNLLWTSGDYWDRNQESVEPREEALRELFKKYKTTLEDKDE